MSSNCDSSRDTAGVCSRPRLSLTLWFAFSNAASTFLILAMIALLLYLGLATQLKEQNHLYLHDEVNMLGSMIRNDGINDAIREGNVDQHGEEYVKHFIRVLDRSGRVLVETEGMTEVAPSLCFGKPLRDGRPGVDNVWRSESGKTVIGTAEWIDLGKRNGEQGVLEVALDTTNVNQILEGYRIKIYGVLSLGFLLCVLVSFMIARNGMRPLREMTGIIRGITVSNLRARIAADGWPEELHTVASATNMMLDRLENSFSRLYNSARNLSHKIRTPLTILKGEAEIALSRPRSAEELCGVIASSLEEHSRLQRLIENILFLGDAEIGKYQIVPLQFESREELENVVDFYTPWAEEKELSISCHGSASVLADPPLFRKAAAALLSNALTYNSPGGEVELRLRQSKAGGAELSVTDAGCGIAESELSKVFDRFYRIYATRYMDPHGTGLGLPIAKAVMELHGGSIEIRSAAGKGTTVTLSFPDPVQ
jgi:two-component system, OmpR family, heavy metal sensor histidine kinase CusS